MIVQTDRRPGKNFLNYQFYVGWCNNFKIEPMSYEEYSKLMKEQHMHLLRTGALK